MSFLCLRFHSLYALQMSILHAHSKEKGRLEASSPLSYRWASLSLSGLQQTFHSPGTPAQPFWDGEKHTQLHTCLVHKHLRRLYIHMLLFSINSVCVLCVIILIHGWIKGIVHPKLKILSSFTLPQVVPDLYECLCSAEHKGRYSEECGEKSSSGSIFFLLWKSMVPQNILVTNFLQNIFLCVRQNKDIHTGLELLEGE